MKLSRRNFVKCGALYLPTFGIFVPNLIRAMSVSNPALVGQANNRSAAAAAGRTATDTFNRVDANPISVAMSDGVHSWVNGPGSLNGCKILGNEANTENATSGCAVAATTSFGSDQESQITVGSTVSGMGCLVRIKSDTDADGYLLYLANASALQFYRIDDTGSLGLTQLTTNVAITTVVAGDTIKLRISGSTLTAYHNGVSVATRTDSNHTTGNPGFYLSPNKAVNHWTATDVLA